MKISIKKKYIVGVLTLISILSGLSIVQEIIQLLENEGVGILIIPAIFVVTTFYIINYYSEYSIKSEIAEEAAKDVAKGDWNKEVKIKEHLIEKISNEAHTLNFLHGKIKFTNNWRKQQEVDKLKSNPFLPDVIKQELISRAKK